MSHEREGGVSPAVQRDEITKFAGERGYVILEWFEDLDLSAFRLPPEKRPALQRMLRQAEDGGCDVVVFYRVDRFARRVEDHMAMRASLEESGVSVDSVGLPWDDSPEGRFMWDLSASLAALESRRLGKRLRDVHRRLAHTGRYHGGPLPYGWQRGTDGLVVDEAEAAWVRWVHEHYQQGWGIQRLCRHLNRAGVRGRNGGAWETRQLLRILDAPALVGATRDADGSLVRGGNIEPLLDLEVWERTQRLRAARSVAKPEGRPGGRLLSARQVRCAECGSWCFVHYQRGGAYYRCRRARMDTCERPTWIAVATVEDYVVGRILRRLSRSHTPARPKPRPDLAPLATTVERLRESLTTLAVMASEGSIGQDEFTAARERQQERLRTAERQLEQGVRRAESGEMEEARTRALVALEGMDRAEWLVMPLDARGAVTRLLVQSVTLRHDEPRVSLEWA